MIRLNQEQARRFLADGFIDPAVFDVIKAKSYIVERRGMKLCYSSHEEAVEKLLELMEALGAVCTPFVPMICTDGGQNTLFIDVEEECILLILNPVYQQKIAEKYNKALEVLEELQKAAN